MENKIDEVRVTKFAEDDLDEIVEYYNLLSPSYVEKTISEFEKNIMSLKSSPKSGRVVPELARQGIENYRELIQGYYRIIYEIIGTIVYIITIIDGRRNFERVIIEKLTRYLENK